MTRILGVRGFAALGAFLMFLVAGPTAALGQTYTSLPVVQLSLPPRPVGEKPATLNARSGVPTPAVTQLPKVQAVLRATMNGGPPPAVVAAPVLALPDAGQVVVHVGSSANGTGGFAPGTDLATMVDANSGYDLDAEGGCLATAVYFESKGEPLEGQLAVAQVVINRSRSGRYPPTLCGVVKQHAQFSFVRGGAFPRVDTNCEAWRKARAIARIAQNNMVNALPLDVLWYHADYVSPRWRSALVQVQKIGAHIFYRS